MQTRSAYSSRVRFKADEVRDILRCQEESGQSLFLYCKENTLPYKTLAGWRRRLQRQGSPKAAPAMFVPVDVKQGAAPVHGSSAPMAQAAHREPAKVEVRLRCGRALRMRANIDAASLRRLIEVVEAMPC